MLNYIKMNFSLPCFSHLFTSWLDSNSKEDMRKSSNKVGSRSFFILVHGSYWELFSLSLTPQDEGRVLLLWHLLYLFISQQIKHHHMLVVLKSYPLTCWSDFLGRDRHRSSWSTAQNCSEEEPQEKKKKKDGLLKIQRIRGLILSVWCAHLCGNLLMWWSTELLDSTRKAHTSFVTQCHCQYLYWKKKMGVSFLYFVVSLCDPDQVVIIRMLQLLVNKLCTIRIGPLVPV